MIDRTIPLAVAVLAISALPAAATPALSGTYTVVGTQYCQVVTGGKALNPNDAEGVAEQVAARIAMTATATGATGQLQTADQWVPLISKTATIERATHKIPVKLTLTGSGNPYAVRFDMTTPSGKMSQTGNAVLGRVARGVAGRVLIVLGGSNGASPTPNCVMRLTMYRD